MIYFGFDEVVYGWERYFDLCNSFELRNAPNPSDNPSVTTLNRWRVDSPKGFAWVLHVDSAVCEELVDAFEAGADLADTIDDAIARTEERAHALAAKALIVETPPELPPSDASRRLIAALGQRFAKKSKRPLLWEPSGLWTREDATAVAADAKMALVIEPFILAAEGETLSRQPVAAFRVTERAAARRQFDAWEMEQLATWAGEHERAFILLAGRFKIPHAKELSLLLRDE